MEMADITDSITFDFDELIKSCFPYNEKKDCSMCILCNNNDTEALKSNDMDTDES